MKTITSLLLLVIGFSGFAQNFTQEVDSFLKSNVVDGMVDYEQIKSEPAELNSLLKQIANAPMYKGNEEKAFLINAYNVFVIKGIVDHYPVDGPLKIDGFFDKQSFTFRGKKITLNGLEKGTLYIQFPDPRLHFALVCAAIGCPKLASFAFVGDKLESQLEDQTRFVINDPTFIRLEGQTATVSQIFEWYAADFDGKTNVIPFIQKYLLKKVKLSPTYSFYEYDWSLNVQK